MKRTCDGCRAFDWTGRETCQLHYKTVVLRYANAMPVSVRPAEECPKPRTYQELMECFQQSQKHSEEERYKILKKMAWITNQETVKDAEG